MITRVTQATIFRQLQSNITDLQRQILDAQNEVSSQKKLNQPSDDPAGAALVNKLNGETSQLNAYQSGVTFGTAVLGAEDGALSQATNIMTRAKEIATEQANGTTSAANRQSASEEVAQLEQEMLSLGNTTIAGRYVFGGLASGSAPFASLSDPGFNASTAYSGPTQPFSIQIATNQTIRLTTPGDQVFGSSIVALDNLRQTLAAGNDPTANIDQLNTAAQDISNEQSSEGARANTLSDRGTQITSRLTDVQQQSSSVEDADLTQSISTLVQLENALQATLASGQTLNTSILDLVQL